MSKRIEGITIKIGADTTELKSAIKGIDSELRNTQGQLRDVNRLLKLDPGNTELIAQKQRILADAIKETQEKLKTLRQASEEAN
jgi:phage-related minor tail protein